jgi:hypothetical protein
LLSASEKPKAAERKFRGLFHDMISPGSFIHRIEAVLQRMSNWLFTIQPRRRLGKQLAEYREMLRDHGFNHAKTPSSKMVGILVVIVDQPSPAQSGDDPRKHVPKEFLRSHAFIPPRIRCAIRWSIIAAKIQPAMTVTAPMLTAAELSEKSG